MPMRALGPRARGGVMRAFRIQPGGVGWELETRATEPATPTGWAVVRPTRWTVAAADVAAARDPSASMVPGHEFVGVVERVEATRDDHRAWVGRRVAVSPVISCGSCERCRGGLAAHCAGRRVMGLLGADGALAERVAAPIANLVALPAGLDDDRAVFAHAAGGAAHLRQMIRVEGKPYITVLGDGVMGLLTAQLLARLNASVRLLGRHPERFTLCERWGIKHRHESEAGRRHDQDVVVDCTGQAGGLRVALQLVRPRGVVVIKGGPASGAVAAAAERVADLGPALDGEVELRASSSTLLSHGVAALAAREADPLPLIGRRVRFADAASGFAVSSGRGVVRVLIEPDARASAAA